MFAVPAVLISAPKTNIMRNESYRRQTQNAANEPDTDPESKPRCEVNRGNGRQNLHVLEWNNHLEKN